MHRSMLQHSFRVEFLDNVDPLISYVFNIMKSLGDSRYIVVVDMSWARISPDLKSRVYEEIEKIRSIFEYRYYSLVDLLVCSS